MTVRAKRQTGHTALLDVLEWDGFVDADGIQLHMLHALADAGRGNHTSRCTVIDILVRAIRNVKPSICQDEIYAIQQVRATYLSSFASRSFSTLPPLTSRKRFGGRITRAACG